MPVRPHGRSNEPGRRGLARLKEDAPGRAPPPRSETCGQCARRIWPVGGASPPSRPLGPQTRNVWRLCDAAAAGGEFVDDESTEAGHSTSSTQVLICQRRSGALFTLEWPAGAVNHWSAVWRLLLLFRGPRTGVHVTSIILVARGVRLPMGLALGPRRCDASDGHDELSGAFFGPRITPACPPAHMLTA